MTDHWRGVPGKFLDDPTAIDGRRFVASVFGWRQIVILLRNIANKQCEQCHKFTPVGDSHHIYGRGGGKREDRVQVNGVQFLKYLCKFCHEREVIKRWRSWREDELQARPWEHTEAKSDISELVSNVDAMHKPER